MTKDQAMQLLQGMDDAAVRRRIQQIAQRQWEEWGISIANTKISLLAEIEHHKIGYGDILVIKDRAERLQAEVEALRGELEAKHEVLERIAAYDGPMTGDVARSMQSAAEGILSQYRRKEDTNA